MKAGLIEPQQRRLGFALLLAVGGLVGAHTAGADAAPTLAWVSRYDGPAHGAEDVHGLGIDNAGNVFVAMSSPGVGTGSDYVTVSYAPDGTQRWAARYNGPDNGNDFAHGLALDSAGNVYVTGRSQSSSGGFQFATVSYTSGGSFRWSARWSGPSNADDRAVAIGVDSAANVYVAGSTYSSLGGPADFALVSYDSNGAFRWARTYNGPGNGDDEVVDSVTDAGGNTYVTGTSRGTGGVDDIATVCYGADGTQRWVQRYAGGSSSAITEDPAGNVYVTGNSAANSATTISYSPTGDQRWVALQNDAGLTDTGRAVAVDSAGNSYVAAQSNGPSDYLILAYDATGHLRWSRRYDGPAGANDVPTAITVDPGGTVYVTGFSAGNGSGNDYATVSYGADGNLLWAQRYNGTANGVDIPTGIRVDGRGNTYVTGVSDGGATSLDAATIRYAVDAVPPVFGSPLTGTDGAGRKTVTISVQDTGSGLASVKVVRVSNCTITVAGNVVASGASYNFSLPPTSAQTLVATKITQSQSASFSLLATDAAGNSALLDPLVVTLRIPRNASTASRIVEASQAERFLTVNNGSPGVRSLRVSVNGVRRKLSLSAGSSASADLVDVLRSGTNVVLLVASGVPGGTCTVMLGGAPPVADVETLTQ